MLFDVGSIVLRPLKRGSVGHRVLGVRWVSNLIFRLTKLAFAFDRYFDQALKWHFYRQICARCRSTDATRELGLRFSESVPFAVEHAFMSNVALFQHSPLIKIIKLGINIKA